MTAPFVKVCGITRAEDACAAAAAGARAVGFVFVPGSPRCVAPATARAIGETLPSRVARVGVVVDLSVAGVRALIVAAGLTAVQAHGAESAADCRSYGVPVVKVVWGGPEFRMDALLGYRGLPLLFDALRGGTRGGTGQRGDWSAARRAVESGFAVLLAGGLGPENVREAVDAVGPVAVDLNSGVERLPGIKDPERIRAAMAALADLDPPEESTWPW